MPGRNQKGYYQIASQRTDNTIKNSPNKDAFNFNVSDNITIWVDSTSWRHAAWAVVKKLK